jgi:hypothetical protein
VLTLDAERVKAEARAIAAKIRAGVLDKQE